MRRLILLAITLSLLVSSAHAWGAKTHQMLCEKTVSDVWGQHYLPCLKDQKAYCDDLGLVFGKMMRQRCLNALASGVDVHPSKAPVNLFADFENHYNFDDCPITWVRPSNEWICDGEGNPAQDTAKLWFKIAANSEDKCMQVRAFCTGAFYSATSSYPPNRVQHLTGCFGESLAQTVDDKIASEEKDWQVSRQCVFKYMKEMAGRSKETTQHLTLVVKDDDIESIVEKLAAEAALVRQPSLTGELYTKPTTSTLQATTTTTVAPQPPTPSETPASEGVLKQLLASISPENLPSTQSSNTMASLFLLIFLFVASLVLLGYTYSLMHGGTQKPEKKVKAPKGVRKMKRRK